ncbi:LysR family transcriptional regulator [Rhizobium lusitanum]|uniref:HTH-type transcriptional regulator TtuA n=1 Tax=Rhizobium lusitanum TaxID=293958 RepID=A0A6L9UFQ7_9HYPH|nr:LysR family transcriptional regulator [Rhizobium lusitanum]NEI74815.1 LysR family transcriptional regulator [Rhizobium lusitanum]
MATPPLNALQAFEAVGRCGTMSMAARELGVTPSAVSQQVRRLEDCLGVTLLERIGRRVEMTSWGMLLHKEVTKGFAQLAYSVDVLERARSQTGIVLTALSSVVNKWIGRKVFEWQALHPEANVRIIGKEDEPRLGDGQSDFRITYGRRAEVHTHFAALYTDWVVPACSPRLAETRELSSPADMLKLPLLNIEWESHYSRPPQWHEWAQLVSGTLSDKLASLYFALSSSAIDAAVNGRGAVLAQVSMIEDELQAGTLVVPFDIRLPLSESYYLAWDRAALEKPYGREFHSWIMSIARKQSVASAPKPNN